MTQPEAPASVTSPTVPPLAVRHSRALLIAVAAIAVVCAILTVVGGIMFAGGPAEEIYRFGLVADLIAMAVTLAILTIAETAQRQTTRRPDAPLNTRFSVFAIIAIVMSAIAVVLWWTSGAEQFGYLLTGVRGRYMYHTGGLFLAGIPWTLGIVFGAWGYRPRAHRVTNVLALVAILAGLFLAVVTTIASVVYGLGYSD
ncbi:MAG TPA: hypothetical protein VGO65_03890 [Pseudolysinimonas sp.]|nr:hypothetical protein [Pseudolysinimonas sp.]